MTRALDAAIHATENFIYKLEGEARSIAEVALRAALHVTPPEDVIEAAIEAASEYVSSTWRGSKAWDTKEYAIAQVAAQAAYHILRAQILGEDV